VTECNECTVLYRIFNKHLTQCTSY